MGNTCHATRSNRPTAPRMVFMHRVVITIYRTGNNMQRSRVLLLIRDLDPESLGARVLTAQMTARWPIACKALHEALNDPARAATHVGGSPYDRNLLLYWAVALTPQHFHQPLGRAARPRPARAAQLDVRGALRLAPAAAYR